VRDSGLRSAGLRRDSLPMQQLALDDYIPLGPIPEATRAARAAEHAARGHRLPPKNGTDARRQRRAGGR
jgi:hypothetical protein